MIEWISEWAGGIIVAVLIGTVIEMILPEGSSKKYIKVVIGVYVVFTIVTPVITKFTGEGIEVFDVLEIDEYIDEAKEASEVHNSIETSNQNSIMNIYIDGMKKDIEAKIEGKGYVVNAVEVKIENTENYAIEQIGLDVEKKSKSKNEESENELTDKNEINNSIEPVESIEKVEIDTSNKSTEANEMNEQNSNNQKSSDAQNYSTKNNLSSLEKQELKDYISSVYEVNKNNIIFY